MRGGGAVAVRNYFDSFGMSYLSFSKGVFIFFMVLSLGLGSFSRAFSSDVWRTDPSRINALKSEALGLLNSGRYLEASKAYIFLHDSLFVQEDDILANLAHSLFQSGDTMGAVARYEALLSRSSNASLRSMALNQLGVLARSPSASRRSLEALLAFFKRALRQDFTNESARFNYEWVKRRLDAMPPSTEDEKGEQGEEEEEEGEEGEENKQEGEQGDGNEQEGKQGEGNEQEGEQGSEEKESGAQGEGNKEDGEQGEASKAEEEKEGEEGEGGKAVREGEEEVDEQEAAEAARFEKINMTKENAQLILDALKQNELQYIQQMRRKPTRPKSKNKPDW